MGTFTVLNFHGIGPPQRQLEPGELAYWISTEHFAAILERIAAHPARGRIRLTFDDGNRSDRVIALPMLQARGLRAEFFVLTGRIGAEGSLDAEDIRALAAAGMGVGSHGVRHAGWTSLPPAVLARELAESKARLEAICGARVVAAGIPFGRYNAAVLRALHAAGYEVAYSSDGGSMREDDFPRPRTSVRGDWTPGDLEATLAGEMPPARRLRRALGMACKRWVA